MKHFLLVVAALLSIAIAVPASAVQMDCEQNQDGTMTCTSATAMTNFGDINSHNEGTNLWAPAGEIHYPSNPQYMGSAVPGYMQFGIKDMFMYNLDEPVDDRVGPTYTVPVADILNMQEGDTDDKDIFVNPKIDRKTIKPEDLVPETGSLRIHFNKIKGMKVKDLGTVVVQSDDEGSIAPDVVTKAFEEARQLGATHIQVVSEGFQRLVRNGGWGLGFATTGAVIGTGGTPMASTSTFGGGYAEGWAGMFDHPYIKIIALRAVE